MVFFGIEMGKILLRVNYESLKSLHFPERVLYEEALQSMKISKKNLVFCYEANVLDDNYFPKFNLSGAAKYIDYTI